MSKATSLSWVIHLGWQQLVDHYDRVQRPLFLWLLISHLLSFSFLSARISRHTLWPSLAWVTQITDRFKGFSSSSSCAVSSAQPPGIINVDGERASWKQPRSGRGVQLLLLIPHNWWKWLSILEYNSTPLGLALKIEEYRGRLARADVWIPLIGAEQ